MYIWNDAKLKKRYERVKEQAMSDYHIPYQGNNEHYFETPTLESWKFPTKSARIWQLIYLAYALGRMRAIKDIDEGKTPISLS